MISGAVSETGIRFLYNGQLGVTTDGNGLYHMRARYYNTDIRRFINRDILTGDITNSQSLNRYSYVQGNPVSSTDPFGLCQMGFFNLDWSTIGHTLLDIAGIFWDGADLINAMWYKAEGNDFMAGVCLLSALPMLGSFAGGTIKAVATGTKYLNKAETAAKYLTLGTKFVSHTAQATMSGIDTYYAAVDAYDAYKAGELGAEEIINLGLAATGTILSTGAAISSGRGLYNLMCSDGVGCKVLTGITGEPHCFVAGTLVSTEDGQRAIEEVEAGDKVWAYDEETGEKGLKEVEEVFVSETDKLIHVETDKEEIITTELHPFYVEGLGFVQAGCLQEGYELKCLDGGKETITDVRVEWLEEAVEVYNFRVADYHTYYVGDGDVLVHNTTCANPSGSDSNTEVIRVRHYTNTKGLKGIQESGIIYARDNNRVYLELADKKPLSRIDAEELYQLGKGKGRNYIEFDINASQLEWIENPRYHTLELTVKGDVKIENAKFVKRKD